MARRAGTALVAGTDLWGARRRDWGVSPMSCMRTGGRNGMESATWLATSCAGSIGPEGEQAYYQNPAKANASDCVRSVGQAVPQQMIRIMALVW